MRHRVKGRKLSRTAAHRKATFRALAVALIKSVTAENHKNHIVTTVAKAKEMRGFIEPLITKAKVDSHHNRKQVFAALQDKTAVQILFDEIAPKAKDRPGGYVRVIKAGFRQGDSAETAVVELVDYNDVKPEGTETKKKRTRRSRSSSKKAEAPKAAAEVKEETAQTEDTAVDNAAAAEVEESVEATADATETTEAEITEEAAEASASEETSEESSEETTAEADTETKAEANAEDASTEESEEDSDEEKA